jgi:hypothetical protein
VVVIVVTRDICRPLGLLSRSDDQELAHHSVIFMEEHVAVVHEWSGGIGIVREVQDEPDRNVRSEEDRVLAPTKGCGWPRSTHGGYLELKAVDVEAVGQGVEVDHVPDLGGVEGDDLVDPFKVHLLAVDLVACHEEGAGDDG